MESDVAASTNDMKVELERMRARLLDLSARNALLNYTHPRARSLRIIDEIPALVLDRLIGNGGTGFRFAPLDVEEEGGARRGAGGWGRSSTKASLGDPGSDHASTVDGNGIGDGESSDDS